MKAIENLNHDLEAELEKDFATMGVLNIHKADISTTKISMSTALARAVNGLHDIERSLAELQRELIGAPADETASTRHIIEELDLPLFEQVRKQVTTIAELGMSMNRRIKAIRKGTVMN